MELIDEGLYFVVHAPRQSGKTTSLLALADEVNARGDRLAIRVSCEAASALGEDIGAVEDSLLGMMRKATRRQGFPNAWLPPAPWPEAPTGDKITFALDEWANQCPVPLVLLFDEIDALYGQSIITVLRQLRDGFHLRPDSFPASVALCGMRDVRDYKTASGGDAKRLGGASPFNIAVDSLRLSDFTESEIAELYSQHTSDTGQKFTDEAIERAFEYSRGQPWLVNAFGREITVLMKVPASEAITADHMEQAKEQVIARRSTHIDSLVDKLEEPPVRRVVEFLIAGERPDVDMAYNRDVSYARDLGIVTATSPLEIANPVYREVLTRALAQPIMDMVIDNPRSFILPGGRIDLDRLLREFVGFWREHGELVAGGRGFSEAGVQMVLLGYFYRIVNGGGFVTTEYGMARKRLDILIRKPYTDADGRPALQREAVELKVWRDRRADPIDEALDQMDDYLDRLGLDTGTIMIFDRRATAAPLTERGVFSNEVTAEGRSIRLLRL